MNVFDFISPEELDDLPEDPQLAFMAFARHAQRRLNEHLAPIDQSEQWGWEQVNEARLGFMNVVVAAAKRFDIKPFTEMEVPAVVNASDATHKQFKSDLDHYMTQLVIDNSIRQRTDSVALSENAKGRIRTYLNALRDCVAKSEMTDAKKEALLKRLVDFEHELEKRRVSLLAITWISMQVLAVPGSLWATAEITTKLITSINQVVAEEKMAEVEQPKLVNDDKPKALLPPRKEIPTLKQRSAFDSDLDDDVPF